jgi:G:T/U-mismatch repair DNA glycosylase
MNRMETKHKFLDLYPINPDSKKLILGTIHPHFTENFEIPFFYGNKTSIWRILHLAFPNEISAPISLNSVLEFLRNHKIGISDTIVRCNRKNPTALDKDLIPLELNHNLIDEIRNSEIDEIFFTSGFGANNAFRLFYVNILGLKITPEIREKKQVSIENLFGRSVKLTILPSPSGSANIWLSKSAEYLMNKARYAAYEKPVKQFKIDLYKEKFRIA